MTMNKEAFSTIDFSELAFVCGGAGGGGARAEEPPPRNNDKRSVNIGYTNEGQQYGIQLSREQTSSNYALCLGKHPHDTKEQCGLPPA
jgi:hypothetical protein